MVNATFLHIYPKELQERLTDLSSNPDHSKESDCSEDVKRDGLLSPIKSPENQPLRSF